MQDRYLPIDYIPRWMEPNYDKESDLRRVFASLTQYPRTSFQRKAYDNIIPSWYGKTTVDRHYYTSARPSRDVPTAITFTSSATGMSSSIELVDTLGSALSRIEPSAVLIDSSLYLFNLSSVSFSVSVSNNYLDLEPYYNLQPRAQDSPIYLTNTYGDVTEFSYLDYVSGSTLYVNYLGDYTLRYLSQSVHSRISSGAVTLTIDDIVVPIRTERLRNVWDTLETLYGLGAREYSSNYRTKQIVQQLSFLRKPDMRISAQLGKAALHWWDSRSSFSFSGSAITNVHTIDLSSRSYVAESPVNQRGIFYLVAVPTGTVYLTWDNRYIDVGTYSVSGWSLTLPDGLSDKNFSLKAVYKSSSYTKSSSGDFILGITPLNSRTGPVLVATSSQVKIIDSIKIMDSWVWRRKLTPPKETAEFE